MRKRGERRVAKCNLLELRCKHPGHAHEASTSLLRTKQARHDRNGSDCPDKSMHRNDRVLLVAESPVPVTSQRYGQYFQSVGALRGTPKGAFARQLARRIVPKWVLILSKYLPAGCCAY
jgi:hypothetical protein